MLQYSGAIWYPMVYDMPARAKDAFGAQKRWQRQMDRARQYIAQVGSDVGGAVGGPPCFSPELRHLNGDGSDPAISSPDQMVFLDQMRAHGQDGEAADDPRLDCGFPLVQPNSLPSTARQTGQAIFTTDKAAYIAGYADRMAPVLAAQRLAGPPPPASHCCSRCAPCSSRSCCKATRSATASDTRSEARHRSRKPLFWTSEKSFENRFPMRQAGAHGAARQQARLGQHHLLIHPISGMAGGGYSEYLLHVLQVSDRRTHHRDGWFAGPTMTPHRSPRLGDPAPLPPSKTDLSKFGVVGNTLL